MGTCASVRTVGATWLALALALSFTTTARAVPNDLHPGWAPSQRSFGGTSERKYGDGTTSVVDSNGRLQSVTYPDGSQTRFTYSNRQGYDPKTGPSRITGITVLGPMPAKNGIYAVERPILQELTRPEMVRNWETYPGGGPIPSAKAAYERERADRFNWQTTDHSDPKALPSVTNFDSKFDAQWDPKTGALTTSSALETTRIYPDGLVEIDDHLQGSTRTQNSSGQVVRMDPTDGVGQTANIRYDAAGNVASVSIAEVGDITAAGPGQWKMPDGTTVPGHLEVGKGMITVVGPKDADGGRRVDQLSVNSRLNTKPWDSFQQPKAQVDYVDRASQKLGGGTDPGSAARTMELLEGAGARQELGDRQYLDRLSKAAYDKNGGRADRWPGGLKAANADVARGWPPLLERQRQLENNDFIGLGVPKPQKKIDEASEAARKKINGFVPTAGDVVNRVIDDIPTKVGDGINYAVDHPFKTVGVVGGSVAVGLLAPELAIVLAAGSLSLNAGNAGKEIYDGYLNGDANQVWNGADQTGDVVIEGGMIVTTVAAVKGLGALRRAAPRFRAPRGAAQPAPVECIKPPSLLQPGEGVPTPPIAEAPAVRAGMRDIAANRTRANRLRNAQPDPANQARGAKNFDGTNGMNKSQAMKAADAADAAADDLAREMADAMDSPSAVQEYGQLAREANIEGLMEGHLKASLKRRATEAQSLPAHEQTRAMQNLTETARAAKIKDSDWMPTETPKIALRHADPRSKHLGKPNPQKASQGGVGQYDNGYNYSDPNGSLTALESTALENGVKLPKTKPATEYTAYRAPKNVGYADGKATDYMIVEKSGADVHSYPVSEKWMQANASGAFKSLSKK